MQKQSRLISPLRFFFAVYATLVFTLSLIILIPFYFIVFVFLPKNKAPFIAHRVSQIWADFLFLAFFIRVKIIGREKINSKVTYIIVSNHQSQLDIPLVAVACKNTFRFLAKAELGKIPLLGYIIRKLYITVDRSSSGNRSRSVDAMIKSLKENISVLVFPEGTRNKTDKDLLEFSNGAFKLAIQSQTPIAVLTIINSSKLQSPLKPFDLSPGTIYAVWSNPIITKGLTNENLNALKEKARSAMIADLQSYKL